ncbi:MAG: glycosyltransferase family 2 protein [Candidatus Ozemobacteraceae bacterium]
MSQWKIPLSIWDLIDKATYANHSAEDFRSWKSQQTDKIDYGKVSIIVTTHNSENFIIPSIKSLLLQTYPNIQIIVVDDASTDGTVGILQKFTSFHANVFLLRLNVNLGTYFAKNYGLSRASGKFVFFQDSDDISHPDRIRLCVHALMVSGKASVSCLGIKFDPNSGKCFLKNGAATPFLSISFAGRRDLFHKFGYFNCTRKASDGDFIFRCKTFGKNDDHVNVRIPLYFQSIREGSLSFEMFAASRDGNNLRMHLTPGRLKYWQDFKNFYSQCTVKELPEIFRFPVLRDSIPVEKEMTLLANPTDPVVFNLCSIPERKDILGIVILSVIQQCDRLNLYLDGYSEIPGYLKDFGDKVRVFTSDEYPGIHGNGKFIGLSEQNFDSYYFTIDDDIIYPPDYAQCLLKKLMEFKNSIVAGIHGIILPELPKKFWGKERRCLLFPRALKQDTLVNLLGTGTLAFHSTLLRGLDFHDFKLSGISDIQFSVLCKLNAIPLLSVARHENWLKAIRNSSPKLWEEAQKDDSRHVKLLGESIPWGMKAINQTLERMASKNGKGEEVEKLRELLRTS